MKKINLSMGLFAIVDDADFELLNQWKWYATFSGRTYYAVRNENNLRVQMHRFLMGAKDEELLDHKDRNGLNNQRNNLRFCRKSQNCSNRRSKKNGTSKYLGVCSITSKKKYINKDGELKVYDWKHWVACIKTEGRKQIRLGRFNDEWEAAKAYNKAAKKYHGEFANLNTKEMNEDRTCTYAKLYTAKGNIKKPWYAYFFVRNPSDGKMHMFKKTAQINYIHNFKKRYSQGMILVTEINSLLKDGWSPFENSKNMLALPEIIDEMQKIKISGLRKRSIDAYKYCIHTFKTFLENENLTFIFPEQFDNKLAFRYADFLTKKGIGNRNFNNQRVMIQSLFRLMEDREIITKNPFSKIKKKQQYPASNLPFSDKQMEDLSSALMLQDYNLYCFTRYMYNLLVRANELTLIKLSYFDFNNWRIKLPPGFDGPTKTKLGRTLEIPETFRDFVKAQELEKLPKDFYLFGRAGHGKNKTLVPAADPVTRNVATVRHLTIARAVGIQEDLTLTTWRDTGAIDALEKYKIDIYKISQQMGHTSIRTTEIYLASIRQKINIEFSSKFGERTK